MKRVITCSMMMLLAMGGARAQEMRTWTSASGATIEAAWVSQQADVVILQKADGEKLRIRLQQLSPADQRFLGERQTAGLTRKANADGEDAPIPPALQELVGRKLVNTKGQRVSPATLTGKRIGLYFSASWCPPCHAFTPVLVKAYNEMQAAGKPFEVVLICLDRNEADMRRYMDEFKMPWLAIPFGDKVGNVLQTKCQVNGIPALIIVDDSGQTITADGRSHITAHGAGAFDSW